MCIENVFNSRTEDPIWNTSYPIEPKDWIAYRHVKTLPFDETQDKCLSFYIHIPFCKQLCSYCEYKKMICPSEEQQRAYLTKVRNDVNDFIQTYKWIILRGFDIGGGTPTALSDDNFHYLMQIFSNSIKAISKTEDFEPSIESTFGTMSLKKAKMICAAGIKRISFGLQSSSESILLRNHRHFHHTQEEKDILQMLYDCGVEKVNLDLMYGLKGQDLQSLDQDLKTIAFLSPEQVTLYELRTNMIGECVHMSKDELYESYCKLYNGLTALGYNARFGQNTFSKDNTDLGVSSYLRNRMINGTAYKGFGISAQSMSSHGLSYNIGKLSKNISTVLSVRNYVEEYTYILPPHELASKYIAIAAYNGSFSLSHLSKVLRCDAQDYYKEQIIFCVKEGLVYLDNDTVYITPKGYKYYGAVFSLFYKPENIRKI